MAYPDQNATYVPKVCEHKNKVENEHGWTCADCGAFALKRANFIPNNWVQLPVEAPMAGPHRISELVQDAVTKLLERQNQRLEKEAQHFLAAGYKLSELEICCFPGGVKKVVVARLTDNHYKIEAFINQFGEIMAVKDNMDADPHKKDWPAPTTGNVLSQTLFGLPVEVDESVPSLKPGDIEIAKPLDPADVASLWEAAKLINQATNVVSPPIDPEDDDEEEPEDDGKKTWHDRAPLF